MCMIFDRTTYILVVTKIDQNIITFYAEFDFFILLSELN